jgi:carbonyl reductase 1
LKAAKELTDKQPQHQHRVQYHQLDLRSVESIHQFAEYLKNKHGGLDILINNAAIAFKVGRVDVVRLENDANH